MRVHNSVHIIFARSIVEWQLRTHKKKTVGKSIWSKHCIKLWVKVFDHWYGYTTVILLAIVFTIFLINIKGLGWNMFNNNFINGQKSLLLSLPLYYYFLPWEENLINDPFKTSFLFFKIQNTFPT